MPRGDQLRKAKKSKKRKTTSVKASAPSRARSLKLHIDLVPNSLHGRNLRSATEGVGKYRWEKLRKQVLEEQGDACAICESAEKPRAHEVWEYSEKGRKGVAKLLRIEIICARCHYIHHWGNTKQLDAEGKLSPGAIDALIAHFLRVNECSRADFEKHIMEVDEVWRHRNKLTWGIDWGIFRSFVKVPDPSSPSVDEKPAPLKFPCRKCGNQIVLALSKSRKKIKSKLGVRYCCESCLEVSELECPPGMDGVIVKGALPLFSADVKSQEWKEEIASSAKVRRL